MSALRKTVAFTITFALVGSSITAAFAETQWERNHPRRDQVNDRLSNQNRRINKELKEGEITKQQANQLHREDRAIRQTSGPWPNSTTAISPRVSKRLSISRRTPSAARSAGSLTSRLLNIDDCSE